MCWKLIAIFNLLQIRMRVDIFGTEKCKVTFGLKYILYTLFGPTNEIMNLSNKDQSSRSIDLDDRANRKSDSLTQVHGWHWWVLKVLTYGK